MIEVTKEMVQLVYEQIDFVNHGDDGIREGLAAVLAIVKRDYDVTQREAVEHGLVGSEELPAVRWNPAAEEFFVDCLCGETFADWTGGGALERALAHLASLVTSPKPGDAR